LFCFDQQSCELKDGKAGCSNWTCLPNSAICSVDGRRVERCAANGESSTVERECEAGEVCANAACRADVCTPNQKFCRAGSVYQCAADGTNSALFDTCATGSHCDDSTGACVTDACKPSTDICQNNQTVHCKADGSGFEDPKDCGKKQVCTGGVCQPIVCDPNAFVCDGNQIKSCNVNGTQQTVSKTCAANETCGLNFGAPACIPNSCSAGQTQCQGNTVVQCNAAGTALEITTDCQATNTVCYGGACQPKVCESGTLSCQLGNVALCVHNGANLEPFQSCSSTQYCDSSAPGCKSQACTPNAIGCNGSLLATCNELGSGYSNAGAIDCAATGQACQAGMCQPIICTPGSLLCQSGDVYQCNEFGTAAQLSTDCADSTSHCAQSGSVAFCAADICTAGVPLCNGNVATKCNNDGDGYLPGTDCGTNQVCVSGTCQSKVCVPGSLTCSGGSSMVCNAQGTAYAVSQSCATTQFCNASTGTCKPDVCPAAAQGCVNEVLGTCNTEGSAELAGGTDCKASGQLCTLTGCAATATDALGSYVNSTSASSSAMFGSVVYVATPRTLTGMQLTFSGSSSPTARWVVFASDNQSGPYTPVFDNVAPASNVTGSLVMQSSGTLSVSLTAGKFYYFGAVIQGSYGYESTTAQRYTSFGHALGSYVTTVGSAPPSSFQFSSNTSYAAMNLLTKLP